MKKILITIETLGGGGAEKVLLNLLEKLQNKNYDIEIGLIYAQGIYYEEIKNKYRVKSIYGEKMCALINKKIPIVSFLLKVYRKIALNYNINTKKLYKRLNKKYDIEIAFLEGPTTLLSSKSNSKKKIGWIHTDLKKHRRLPKSLEMKAYEKMDEIICVSKDSKKSFLDLYPKFDEKTKVIYNFIPKKEVIEKSKEVVEQNNKITLVSVGRLGYEKGYDILLKAHKKLIDEGVDYKLQIIGDGKERKAYDRYILKNNLIENTELLGFKENPYPYIKNADIFISSSRYEGFPLVLCEAIILRKPIIATKCTGPIEILDNGKYGKLANIENINELASKMKELILNQEERRKYEKLSEERFYFFEEEKILQKIEELLV